MATKQQLTAEGTVERDQALELYRRMKLIRRFEETVQRLFLRGEVHGTTHLYIGQEAVATGFGSVVEEGDRVAATYRGHGHALSVGVSPQALLDEMLGRATGVCAGRAGSMNVVDLEHRLIGSFGIIGGSMAPAAGAALAPRRPRGGAAPPLGGPPHRRCRRRLLRRRLDQPRLLPRVPELRRRAAAAGRLHLREQPLR